MMAFKITCIFEKHIFPFSIDGIIIWTFLRYCEQIVMTNIVLKVTQSSLSCNRSDIYV